MPKDLAELGEKILTDERYTTRLIAYPKIANEFKNELIQVFKNRNSYGNYYLENRFIEMVSKFVRILEKIYNKMNTKKFDHLNSTIDFSIRSKEEPEILPIVHSLIITCKKFLEGLTNQPSISLDRKPFVSGIGNNRPSNMREFLHRRDQAKAWSNQLRHRNTKYIKGKENMQNPIEAAKLVLQSSAETEKNHAKESAEKSQKLDALLKRIGERSQYAKGRGDQNRNETKNALIELGKKLALAELQNEMLRTANAELANEYNALRAKQREEQEQQNSLQETLKVTAQKLTVTNNARAQLQSELELKTTELDEKVQELKESQEQVQELSLQKITLQKTNERIKADAVKEVGILQSKSLEQGDHINKLTEESSQKIVKLERNIETVESRIKELTETIASQRQEISAKKQLIEDREYLIQDLSNNLKKLNERLKDEGSLQDKMLDIIVKLDDENEKFVYGEDNQPIEDLIDELEKDENLKKYLPSFNASRSNARLSFGSPTKVNGSPAKFHSPTSKLALITPTKVNQNLNKTDDKKSDKSEFTKQSNGHSPSLMSRTTQVRI